MADAGMLPAAPADLGAARRLWSWLSGRSVAVARNPVTASIVIAFVLVAIVILVSGSNPLEAYAEIWKGAATKSGPRTVVNRAVPIVGMAIALSIPFRTGIVNLGGEGQMVIGGFAAAITAINMPGPGILRILVAVVAGALVGATWAALPAIGQAWLKLPILITSLLLNAPAVALCSYLVKFYFLDTTETSNTTVPVGDAARIPAPDWLAGASVSAIAVLMLVASVSLRNNRTVAGYEGYISGLNLRFSRYGGVRTTRQAVLAMLAGGAVAGAVGAHLVLGQSGRFVDGDLDGSGFAWTGLLVTLLAAHRAWPVLAAGVFFSALQVGGLAMQRTAGVSWQLAQVLQAVVILALVARVVFVRTPMAPAERPDT